MHRRKSVALIQYDVNIGMRGRYRLPLPGTRSTVQLIPEFITINRSLVFRRR